MGKVDEMIDVDLNCFLYAGNVTRKPEAINY